MQQSSNNKQGSIFLNADSLADKEIDEVRKAVLEFDTIEYEVERGFNKIPLIERLRLLEILDDKNVKGQDKYDFAFEITMQLIEGKVVNLYWRDENRNKNKIYSFILKSRFDDLNGFPVFFEYPCLLRWLINYATGYELKKYPLSSENILGLVKDQKELLTQ